MEIFTVKLQGDGYLANGNTSISGIPGSRYYKEVQEWIGAGNTPEPEFTQAELDTQAVQDANAIELEKLAQLDLESIRDIREYIAAQPDAPSALVAREDEAKAARAKLR